SLPVKHPVMIVTSTKLQLLVVIPDPSPDRGRLVEIERRAGDGLQLPGWNQTFVDGGELAGLDHQFVAQNVAGSSIFQVEVGMVSKIDNGRLIRLGGILDLQTVLVRQSVSNRTTEIPRKAFFPIFARVRQLERRSVAGVYPFGFPDHLVESLATPVQRVLAVVRHEVVIDTAYREFTLPYSVAITADYASEIWRIGEVVTEVVIPKHHIGEFSAFVGHQQRNDDSTIVSDFGFKSI